jgi:hypothetical protein
MVRTAHGWQVAEHLLASLREMAETNDVNAIRIASSGALAHTAWFATGLGCLVLLPIAAGGLMANDPIGLFFVAVVLGMVALAIWTTRTTPTVFATLTADGLILNEGRNDERVIPCGDIESIRWPVNGGLNVPIYLKIRNVHTDASQMVTSNPRTPPLPAERS